MSTSLTELLTVLAVVGILTAGAVGWCGSARKGAPVKAQQAYTKILKQVEGLSE